MDLDALMALPWTLPTAEVETPARMVAAGAPAHYVVRMPTAEDMARANNIQGGIDKIKALVAALDEIGVPQRARAVKDWLGMGDALPPDYVRQVEYVLLCVSEPKLDRQSVLWLARFQPFFFKALFEKAMLLAFEGADPGESPVSTEIPESLPPSTTAT